MNQAFLIENSYLRILEPDIQMEDVAVYKMRQGELLPVYQSGHKTYLVCVLCIVEAEKIPVKKVLGEVEKILEPNGKFHILFQPVRSKALQFGTIHACFSLQKALLRHNWTKIELYGIQFDPWSPSLIVPFKKNIFRYVMISFYRRLDSPFRHMVKKLRTYVLGFWVWKGPVVLVCSR